jgi:hypothetical protein
MFRSIQGAAAGIVVLVVSSVGCSQGPQGESPEGEVGSATEAISMGPVDVIEATYGANCGAPRTNATWSVVDQCDGLTNCAYRISTGTLGDPKFNCKKDFNVRWACGTKGVLNTHVIEEANQQTVTLACQNNLPPAFGSITIRNATYGGNCGQPTGNATSDAQQVCSGFGSCAYDIRTAYLGDPAFNCSKEYFVNYTCSNHPNTVRQEFASREANGKTVTLTCPQ